MRLFELIAKLTPKAVNLFKSNAVFNNLNKNEISNLFLARIKEYKKNRLINNFKYSSFNADKCSRDYANGMASCDTNFTISTAASILAGAIIIFGTAGTGVVGGAVAVTGGIAGAYAALVVCRGDVVEAWEDCRNV